MSIISLIKTMATNCKNFSLIFIDLEVGESRKRLQSRH